MSLLYTVLLTLLLPGSATPCSGQRMSQPLAQTTPTSPEQARAGNRQALREARHVEAPYKDTHLDVSREHLRRDARTRAPSSTDEPRFRRDGTPRVKPTGWPWHQPKNKPRPAPRS